MTNFINLYILSNFLYGGFFCVNDTDLLYMSIMKIKKNKKETKIYNFHHFIFCTEMHKCRDFVPPIS
jgi:hypothetical protein